MAKHTPLSQSCVLPLNFTRHGPASVQLHCVCIHLGPLHWLLAWAGQLGVVTALSEPYALSKAWMYSGIAAT